MIFWQTSSFQLKSILAEGALMRDMSRDMSHGNLARGARAILIMMLASAGVGGCGPSSGSSSSNTNLQAQLGRGPVAAESMAGEWHGTYALHGTVSGIDLTLTDSDDNRLSGNMTVHEVLASPQRSEDPAAKTFNSTATFDPACRTIVIAVAEQRSPGFASAVTSTLSGVYSKRRDEIGGTLRAPYGGDAAFFVLVRANKADGLKSLEKRVASLHNFTRPSPFDSSPGSGALKGWIAAYEREYPGQGMHTQTQVFARRALPLLMDDEFKPVFGDTYDEISAGKLAAAADKFQHRMGHGFQTWGQDDELTGPLSYGQYILHPDVEKILAVRSVRVIQAWRGELVSAMNTMPPTVDSFRQLDAMQGALEKVVTYDWPSRRPGDQTVAARKRLAGPVIVMRADDAVKRASGEEGAAMLNAWSVKNSEILHYAPQNAASSAQAKVQARLDAMLTQQMGEQTARIAGFGTGITAVDNGSAWYMHLRAAYGFAVNRPVVQSAIGQLAARRAGDLAAAQGDIQSRINRCKTSHDVDSTLASVFIVPGDQMQSVADTRRAAIVVETKMALCSREEVQCMDGQGNIDVQKLIKMGPSPDGVRLALLRGCAAGTGKVTSPTECNWTAPIIPIKYTTTVTQVRFMKNPIGPFSERILDDGEWIVVCRIDATDSYSNVSDAEMNDPNNAAARLFLAARNTDLLQLADSDVYLIVHATSDGWTAPELQNTQEFNAAMQKAMTAAVKAQEH
jgi:hypothetical protein